MEVGKQVEGGLKVVLKLGNSLLPFRVNVCGIGAADWHVAQPECCFRLALEVTAEGFGIGVLGFGGRGVSGEATEQLNIPRNLVPLNLVDMRREMRAVADGEEDIAVDVELEMTMR
jgi:hypothetical protein